MQPVLRVREGLAIALGSIIGMGILRTPGIVAGYLGDAWSILAVWFFGGVVAALSALVMAEMAAALPLAGGKYVYAREAFGPVAGFVTGWSELGLVKVFAAAAKAVVIAEYLILLTGAGNLRGVAVAVVLVFAALHLGGIRLGALFQNAATFTKVAILAAIAAAGLWTGEARGFAVDAAIEPSTSRLLGFAISYQLVSFTCRGWEDALKMSEEIRNPGPSIPRILLGAAGLVLVLYLVVIASFLTALTPAEMAGSPLVAQEAIARVVGPLAGKIMLVASLLIIISTLNVDFLGMPRVAFALARDRLAPGVFTRVSRLGTPVPALLATTAFIIGLSVTGAFEMLIRFQTLVHIIVDLVILVGFFRLRKLRPDLHRPFRVPGYPWLPIATVFLFLVILGVIVATQPSFALTGAAILAALGAVGMLRMRRLRTLPPV